MLLVRLGGWNTVTVSPSPADLENSVVWSVIRAAHVLEREVTTLFAGFQLSPVQFGVLSYLGAIGPMTTAELARSILVRPQSITRVIDSLEERGLLARAGKGGRGRANPVRLTEAGDQLLGQVWPDFSTANQPHALGLKAEQVTTLAHTMRIFLAAKAPTQP